MSERPAIAPQMSQIVDERMSFAEFLKRYDGRHAEWLVDRVLIHVANNLLPAISA
jgi:hypothetical protein